MNKKFLTLLTCSAITMMALGTVFASDDVYRAESPRKTARLLENSHKTLNREAPEYKVYEATLRFKFILSENPEDEIKEKLRARLSNTSEADINSALIPIKALLEKDTKTIVEQGPQKGVGQVLQELNAVYSDYLKYYDSSDLFARKENDRYYQKASLGYAFTLPKLVENTTNETRLKKLSDIASRKQFSEKRKAFAQFATIEQKVKHSLIEPTKPPYQYEPEVARLEYNILLENQYMSMTTRLSIQYHLIELDYKNIGIVARNLESIKAEFQEINDHPAAHAFTKTLAKRYLTEIETKEKAKKKD